MPCPADGQISIQSLVDEFGGSPPHALTEYYRNGSLVPGNNTNVPESGQFALTNCYSAVNEIQHTHSDGDTHANYATIFGSNYASTVPKRVIVPAGVTVGATNTHAMLLPSGMGGTIVFDISGNVHGHGGAANGGNGGDAIHCIQTTGVTINVASTGKVQAGGGGGGQGGSSGAGGAGGTGGAGGDGGMGYYWSSSYGDVGETNGAAYSRRRSWYMCGAAMYDSSGYTLNFTEDCYSTRTSPDSSNYLSKPWGICAYKYSLGCGFSNGKTTACASQMKFIWDFTSSYVRWESTSCIKRLFQNGASGGAGGAGGSGGSSAAGGAGGVGQGFNQSAGTGSAGAAGNAGAAGSDGTAGSSGSNNAGNGGQGGTGGQGGSSGQGGTGGNGGSFGGSGSSGSAGNDGATGNTGGTGNTGANGNTYNGSAGSAGSNGSSGNSGSNGSGGGSSGYYIYNRSSITLNTSAGATLSGQ